MTLTTKTDKRHGTLNGYTNHRCRCDRCRAAARRYYVLYGKMTPCARCGSLVYTHGTRTRQAYADRGGLCGRCFAEASRIDTHGTETTYKWCRCDACREAAAEARRRRRHEGVVRTHNANGYCNGCRCDVCTEAHRARRSHARQQ